MKKLYTLYFFVLIVMNSHAQIINFPDANFKAKLLAASPSNQIGKDISGNYIKIDANNNGEIEVIEALQISWLDVNNQNASTSNLFSDVSGIENFTNLIRLNIAYNSVTAINVSPFTSLQVFLCQLNQITSLDFTGLTNLTGITAWQNQLTSINVNGLINLTTANFDSNQLMSVDFDSCRSLNNVYCSNNQLVWMNIKNGKNEANIGLGGNPTLRYICADEGQLNNVQNLLDVFGMTNCNKGTYCSFTPGGVYYTILGDCKFDIESNGCDLLDIQFPYLKLNFSNSSSSGSIITNSTGNYSLFVQSGVHTIMPVLENPTYYSIAPSSASATFPSQTSPYSQDFCITSNGIHNDLEASIIPLTVAWPGFDSRYKVIYKNKGTQPASGTVTFAFDDDHMDFVSSMPMQTNQSYSLLSWDYTDLLPFETREIIIQININSPTEIPAVNIGDIIKFSVVINPINGDEYTSDNANDLRQVVVGSFDPNDKTCVEGNTITPSMIGQYVHYVIRFENTGTFPAQNVVVSDVIDTTKFDIASLIPQSSSHSFVTRINNATGKVEFIFENINLPFDDANNDGYVAFKIKTKSTLVLGNTFSNTANIYFDFNFPIVTNTATTTISALANQDFDFGSYFSVYPIPAKDVLHLETKNEIGVKAINIYNTLGQMVLVVTNPENNAAIDVANLKTGTYFIKVLTDKGTSNTKFVKE